MAFKSLKPEEFLAYWRRAGRQSSEILQLPTNSDVTTSPELDYTHTNDILDPEIRRTDGSIQPMPRPQHEPKAQL